MNQLVPMSATAASFSVSDVERVALAIAKGGLFGSKDPNAVLTLCLLAQAEGQHPAVVFRDYHIISGKPAKKAEAMLRDFLNAGGKIEWHELSDTAADATFSHPAGGSARISWDHARAQRAQIAGNAMYKKYPRQMLRSRCISEGVRTIYPGATSGLYVEEEVSTFDSAPAPANDEPVTLEHAPQDVPESQKVQGISKIKQRLRLLQTAGDKAETLEAFNALVHDNAEDLTKIKEANHSWWTGDGEDFEGFKSWIIRRRAELAEDDGEAADLIRSLKECETKHALDSWKIANMETVEAMDGAASRKVQMALDLHESGIDLMDTADA